VRAYVLIALALMLASTTAIYAGEMPAPVSLVVNGKSSGDTLILIGDGGVSLDTAAVARLEIDVPVGAPLQTYGESRFVALAALAPRVHYVFDEKALTLTLTVAAKGLQHVELARTDPANADRSRPSGFVNYDAVESSAFGTRGFLEGDLGSGPVRFYANAGYAGSLLLDSAYVQRYDAGYRVEGDIGTFTTAGDGLVASSDLAGVVFRRSFALNPSQASYPLPAVSGIATGPAVADVYVDGNLVRSVPLAPGPFVLAGIPTAAVPGRVTVLVRDQNGGVQQISHPFDTAASLLAPGTADFSYAAGSDRVTGMPVADALYRLGLPKNVTIGSRVVSGPDGTVTEATADAAFGAATFHTGYARAGTSQGVEGAVQVTYRSGSFGVDMVQQPRLRSSPVGLGQLANPIRSETATVSQSLSRSISISASTQRNEFASAATQSNETVGIQTRLRHGAVASALLEHDRTDLGRSGDQLAIQLEVPLGSLQSATGSLTSSGSGVGFVRSLPGPVGTGYALQVGNESSQALYQIRTANGDLTASVDRFGGLTSSYLEVAGGLAAVGSAVGLTRRIDDAFAVVDVPGVAGAPVFVDHQFAGDTDKRGMLVVNGLHAFVPTQVSIGYERLPLDVELKSDKIDVTPGVRGGALAVFPATHLHLVAGSVVLVDGSPAPAYASVVFSGADREESVRLDEGGRFTIDHVSPGKYRLSIEGQSCSAKVDVPRTTNLITPLGTIRCERSPVDY
jgi:outer membrane usher protein